MLNTDPGTRTRTHPHPDPDTDPDPNLNADNASDPDLVQSLAMALALLHMLASRKGLEPLPSILGQTTYRSLGLHGSVLRQRERRELLAGFPGAGREERRAAAHTAAGGAQ